MKSTRLAICGGTPSVRFDDVPASSFTEEETRLLQVLRSGVWGGYSQAVSEFEAGFGRYLRSKHCITTANGTVSLEVALRCEGIGPGDEVIVPPYTFMATASAVLQTGAVPVFADVERSTLNLDPDRFAAAITQRTRAVIPVHFGGHAADMQRILAISRRNGLVVIEDAAHAHGGEHNGQRLGTLSEWGSFSFQQSKVMTSGEGGCLTTSDDNRDQQARSFCNQGRIRGGAWYDHYTLGTNLRLTGFQAAVLLAQLERLDAQLAVREKNAALVRTSMLGMAGVEPLLPAAYCSRHAGALFLFRYNPAETGLAKSAFEAALKAEGVPVVETYPRPLYKNPVFEKWPYRDTECPVAEESCSQIVTLPLRFLNAGQDVVTSSIEAIDKVLQNADQLQSHPANMKA